MDNFEDKIMQLRRSTGKPQKEIAKLLNTSPTYISGILSGKRKAGKGIISRLDVLIKQFSKEEPNVREDTDYPKRMRRIPVVSWAQAGQGIAFEDLCSQISEWVDTDVQDENAYSLIIEGDSMEPAFSAGDRLIVSPNAIPRVGHYVVAQLLTGEIMFKKYFRAGREGKIVRLESINPNYAPREIPQEQFAKIQPVLQCTKIL